MRRKPFSPPGREGLFRLPCIIQHVEAYERWNLAYSVVAQPADQPRIEPLPLELGCLPFQLDLQHGETSE